MLQYCLKGIYPSLWKKFWVWCISSKCVRSCTCSSLKQIWAWFSPHHWPSLFSCLSSYEIFIQTAVGSAICLIPLQIWAEQFYDLFPCLWQNFYKDGKCFCFKNWGDVGLLFLFSVLEKNIIMELSFAHITPKIPPKQTFAKIMASSAKQKGSGFELYTITS